MSEGVELMGWALFCMVVLVLLAEIVDMIAAAFRRLRAGERLPIFSAGGFNLQPRESTLSQRHYHRVRTSSGTWGGPNKVE